MSEFIDGKKTSKNKTLIVNLIMSIIPFMASLIINLFLPPYIVRELGIEANGFITLANNFITYGVLISLALNSMAGRFITIEIHKGDSEKANVYYSSLTVANVILSIVLILPVMILVYFLEYVINIPSNLLKDVKVLFLLVFISFLLSMALSSWQLATFITNKLYLKSLTMVKSQVLRVVVIVSLFILFNPSIYFIGVGTFVITIYGIMYSLYYKRKLLPELQVTKKRFSMSSLIELVKAGIWNTITHAGQLLLSGVDLLIANLILGSSQMGMLALAKSLPLVMTQLSVTLTSVFAPTLTISFAKGDLNEVKRELKKSMKLLGIALNVPLSILLVFGDIFYSLWVPLENAEILQTLSVLTVFGLIFTSGIQSLYYIFTVVNSLKVYSLLILLSGVINLLLVFLLLNFTDLGIYAVAASSSIVNLAHNMFYTVPFAAKYLNLKWNTFFPEVFYSLICVLSSVLIGTVIRSIFTNDSWLIFLISVFITGCLALFVNINIVLTRIEKQHLMNLFKSKIGIRDKV